MALVPTLDEIITDAIDSAMRGLFISMPVKVKAFDSAGDTVDVEPQVRVPIPRLDDSILNEDLPVIPAVPILWMKTGNTAITFPIEPGDFGLLIILSYSASAFLDSGQPSDPGDVRAHHIANSVFLPGFGPKSTKPDHVGDPDFTIQTKGAVKLVLTSASEIDVVAPDVRLGDASASDFVALASKCATEFTNIASALSHLVAPAGGGTCTGNTYVTPGSVAATKVKAL